MTEQIERRLLSEIAVRGSVGRTEAAALLQLSPDVITHMWASSAGRPRREMRLQEAVKLAKWLGYDLRLDEATPATSRQSSQTRPRAAPRDSRRAARS